MGPIWSKNVNTSFSPNKQFWAIISLYVTVTFSKNQKISKSWFLLKLEKPHFWPIFALFSLQTSK